MHLTSLFSLRFNLSFFWTALISSICFWKQIMPGYFYGSSSNCSFALVKYGHWQHVTFRQYVTCLRSNINTQIFSCHTESTVTCNYWQWRTSHISVSSVLEKMFPYDKLTDMFFPQSILLHQCFPRKAPKQFRIQKGRIKGLEYIKIWIISLYQFTNDTSAFLKLPISL